MKLFSKTIPLHISPSFWILACLIAFLASGISMQFALWLLIVFASVLVHELGHATFATLWGQNVQIVLGPLGGTTVYGGGKKALSRIKEFIVVLAGPVFGLLLAAVAYFLLAFSNPLFQYFLYYLTVANIFWSLFNLLPVHPMDGGKLMSILFEGIFGAKGMRASYLLSGIFAIALSTLAFVYHQIFAGALLLLCAFESFKNYREGHFFQTTAKEKEADLLEELQGVDALEEFVSKTKDGRLRADALYKLAKLYAASDKNEQAYSLLAAEKKLDSDSLKLLQYLAYKLGRYKEAVESGNLLLRERQDMAAAIINAFSSARLGDIDAAINWLSMVKRSKAVDMQALLASTEFEPIRNDERFKRL